MIGVLPKSLTIDEVEYNIDSDFRTALLIMQMYNDRALSEFNVRMTMLNILFTTIPDGEAEPITVIPRNVTEAEKQALWFLNIGQNIDNENKVSSIKTIDYKKDEQMIFSAVNAVVSRDVREESYMHWWTFYGYCQAISNESLISIISNLRYKLAKHEKLDEHEKIFLKENKDIILLNDANDKSDYEQMMSKLRSRNM